MPAISQLGHLALVTPDLEASLGFYRDLLGLEEVARDGDTAYLRCYQELEHHSLVLREDDYTGVDHIALRCSAPGDVGDYAAALRAGGVEVTEVGAGEELGQGEAIRFTLPHAGQAFELFYEIDRPLAPESIRSLLPTNSSRRRGLGVRRIDHVNISAPAPEVMPTVQWLTTQLGLRLREYFQPSDAPIMAAWMSVTPQPHDVAIMPDSLNLPGRLHHLAFNLENHQDSLYAAQAFTEAGVQIDAAPGMHGLSQGLFQYVREPGSGHRVELYAGGYQIYAPDWEPVRWDETNFAPGMRFFGPDFLASPGQEMLQTTPGRESDPDAREHGARRAAVAS